MVKKNSGASLIDLGDGVLLCEFHSKMNAIGEDVHRHDQRTGIAETEKNFDAMVIGNQGENFSVGANLMLVLLAAQEEEWDELNAAISRFQKCNMAIKYAPKPVVAAPFGIRVRRRLRDRAAWRARAGFGRDLHGPGGSRRRSDSRRRRLQGTARARHRAAQSLRTDRLWPRSPPAPPKRATSGYLRDGDGISMNPERLIGDAKALALSLVPDYTPGLAAVTTSRSAATTRFALLKPASGLMRQGDYISDYDAVIGEKLAYVLSGGRSPASTGLRTVSARSRARSVPEPLRHAAKRSSASQHMLKTGKPLRN